MSAARADAIAVTGALGWLGSRLVEVLLDGLPDGPEELGGEPEREIRILVEPHQTAAAVERFGKRVAVVAGDLRDPATLPPLFAGARITTLVHSAGVIHPTRVRDFIEINAGGTRNLLEAAREVGLRRFIHVSSNSPLGCNPHPEHRFDESSPYHPYMGYGRSKMEAELLVREAGSRGDFETVIVRCPWFYGPGQPPRQSTFFTLIRTGRLPLVGDGGNRRSMAYLDNLCQGLLLCERVGQAAGRIYWIADRVAYPMREIIEVVERVIERDFGLPVAHRRIRLPGWTGDVATWVDRTLQAVGVYHQKIHVLGEMNKNIACSIARAEEELGYRPRIALEEGMRRSIAWLLEQGIRF